MSNFAEVTNFFKNRKFKNFEDFESNLRSIEDSVFKGDIFEEFNRLYFEFYKERYNLENIWVGKSPEHQVPNSIRNNLGIAQNDMGSDGVIETIDEKYYVVQSKFRSDRSSPSYTELTNATYESRNCEGLYIFANSTCIPSRFDCNDKVLKILFNDLINLDDSFFEAIYKIANNQEALSVKKHKPHIYQEKAIKNILDGFKTNHRGQYIAACGSGKTLTALWVKENMEAKKTLVMVPSIYLIKQTLEEWVAQRSDKFIFCCICSDGDINKINNNDAFDPTDDFIDIDPNALGIKVTTNSDELTNFFETNKNKSIVIFSTYQSSQVVSEAAKEKNIQFDLMICDEAHKTSGIEKKIFSNVLKDEFIESSKRLFLTATPKVLSKSSQITADNLNFEYHSMDNETIYGPKFHTFSFADAIAAGAITNYEILITAMNNSDAEDFKSLNNFSLLDDRNIENKDIAIIIAVEKLMSDPTYDVDKALNFSSTIDRSEDFIKNINIPGIDNSSFGISASISSRQNSKKRASIMHEFIASKKAILSNARCLTEGVDVPGVDAVIFSDKKKSPIDIVQAVGRALRKNDKKPNKVARIFIPIFIDDNNTSIDINKYKYIFEIIESLRMHDNQLSAVIDDLHGALVGIPSGNTNTKIKIKSFNNVDIKKLKKILIPQVARLNGQVFKDLQIKYSGLRTEKPKVHYSLIDRHNIKENGIGNYITRENLRKFSIEHYINYQSWDSSKVSNKKMPSGEPYIEFISNNFAAHTERYEVLERIKDNELTKLRLTQEGKNFVDGDSFTNIAARLFDKKNSLKYFPYMKIKEILKSVNYVDELGFYYGINLMLDNDENNVQNAIKRIENINSSSFNFQFAKHNLATTQRVIDEYNERYAEELNEFNFKYLPEVHIFNGGLSHEFTYLGNQMTMCWPDKYTYDKEKRRLSVK